MSGADAQFAPTRILVALDASPGSLTALDAAAELAARLRAELIGLFVEDVNLLRLGDHPEARQVTRGSGAAETLDSEGLESQLRAVAARARSALLAASARTRVTASLRVVRGSVTAEVVAASGRADLLILGWASRPLTPRARLGRTARAAAERAPGSVLLLPQGAKLAGPVLVVYDGAPGAEVALQAALRLGQTLHAEVVVVGAAAAAEEAQQRTAHAERVLGGGGLNARCRPVVGDGPGLLRAALRAERKGVVVVSAASPLVAGDRLGALLDEAWCPVLLAR